MNTRKTSTQEVSTLIGSSFRTNPYLDFLCLLLSFNKKITVNNIVDCILKDYSVDIPENIVVR
jgi:hypothetical protein